MAWMKWVRSQPGRTDEAPQRPIEPTCPACGEAVARPGARPVGVGGLPRRVVLIFCEHCGNILGTAGEEAGGDGEGP